MCEADAGSKTNKQEDLATDSHGRPILSALSCRVAITKVTPGRDRTPPYSGNVQKCSFRRKTSYAKLQDEANPTVNRDLPAAFLTVGR